MLLNRIINKLKRISIVDTFSAMLNKKLILFWSHGEETDKNFGDAINPMLFEQITKKKVVNSSKIINLFKKPSYYFIGSILDNLNKNNAIVCGTGFQNENAKVLKKPSKIIAVRGPLTRNIFLKYNIECPEVYCDPALLLPNIYMPKNLEKKYDVGIIAHYIDKEVLSKKRIIDNNLTYHFIDIESDWKMIIEEISKSRYILSSSLHGIIVAHAYGVPAVRIKLSDMVVGGDFKFNDYALSVNDKPFEIYQIEDEIVLDTAINLSDLPNTKDIREKFSEVMKGL